MVKLFEYAAIYAPKPLDEKVQSQIDAREKACIIILPLVTLAEDEKEVMMIASRQISEEYSKKLSDVQILIRPF